jgi:HD-like signal output (HDOD) protein
LRRACANWLPLLVEPDADLRRIAEFAQAHAVLAQAVIRMANAPAFGRRRRETRVDHAVALLGQNRLREWAARTADREAAGIAPAFRSN